jgi:hypothetical protein
MAANFAFGALGFLGPAAIGEALLGWGALPLTSVESGLLELGWSGATGGSTIAVELMP